MIDNLTGENKNQNTPWS